MWARNIVQNKNGKFLVVTTDASNNIQFGNGYESMVHPIEENGEPNFNKVIDYKHSINSRSAIEVHNELVSKHNNGG